MSNDDEIELALIPGATGPVNQDTPSTYCSFCGKSEHEVSCMLTVPDAAICDNCIESYKTQLAGEASDQES